MATTSIEWTDKTWNPVTGCTKVSPGCALREATRPVPYCVVTSDELARASLIVETTECPATAASAVDGGIRIVRLAPAFREARPMLYSVVEPRLNGLDVLGSVVGLDSVEVMRDLAFAKAPSELLFCDESVFIDVAANVSQVMPWHFEQDIPARCDRSAALPVGITNARVNDAHRIQSNTD